MLLGRWRGGNRCAGRQVMGNGGGNPGIKAGQVTGSKTTYVAGEKK